MSLISLFFPERDRQGLPTTMARRVPFLVGTNLLLLAYFLLAAIMRFRADPKLYLAFFLAICLTEFVLIASLILVRLRRYMAASYVGSLGVLLDVAWIALLLPFTDMNEIYRFGVYLLGAMTATSMIAFEQRQVFIYFGVSVLLYFGFIFGIAAPKSGGFKGDVVTISITVFLLSLAVNLVMILMTNLNHAMLGIAEREATRNLGHAEKLRTLVAGSKSALETGKELLAAAEESRRHSVEIRRGLDGLQVEAAELSGKATCADADTGEARERMDSARKTIGEQNIVIADTGASVERMAGTIRAIADLAQSKRGTIEDVAGLAERQGRDIRSVLEGMNRIRDSSGRVMEAVGGILDISEKTQLLAMNASIEAAHAGATGKGFAVIAGEIRKLSQETRESTRRIGDAVKTNDTTIREQAESIGRFTADIDLMIANIKAILDALGQIIDGLSGMAKDTGSLTAATGSMLRLARDTQDSVLGVTEGLESGARSAAVTKEFACGLAGRVKKILEDFASIEQSAEKAEQIGEKSLERMAELDEGMARAEMD